MEHMIQKNQCLFTNTQCKVCCALLISESQKLAHYQSKKHANKVKRYLAIHGMETLKGEMKRLDSDQKSSRSKDKNQCCPICNMTFSSPVVAQSHYLGKTHAKNLKLKQQSTKVEGTGFPEWCYIGTPPVLKAPMPGAPRNAHWGHRLEEVELLLRALKNIRVDTASLKCSLRVLLT